MMDSSLKLYKGFVTHVTDPSSFWMQIGSDYNFDSFKLYQEGIDQLYNSSGDNYAVQCGDVDQGNYVVVKRKGERSKRWRRARVARVQDDALDVFYVDYGFTEIVNVADVRHISPPFFEHMGAQAIRVGLAGIVPLSRSWTSRAISAFEKWVLEKSVIAMLLEIDEAQSFATVALYVRGQDGHWHSVTHRMLHECFGQASEYSLSLEERLTHDTVDRALILMNQEEFKREQYVTESEENQDNVNGAKEEESPIGEIDQKPGQRSAAGISSLEGVDDDSSAGEQEEDVDWEHGVHEERHAVLKNEEASENLSEGHQDELHSQDEEELELEVSSSSSLSEDEDENDNQGSDALASVSGFNIGALSHTKSVKVEKMQMVKGEETKRQRRVMMEQDLERCNEDMVEGLQQHNVKVNWGRTDSQVGAPHEMLDSDIQESICEELYNKALGDYDEKKALYEAFKYMSPEKTKDSPRQSPHVYTTRSDTPPQQASPRLRTSREDKPLSEEERYIKESEIGKILGNQTMETPEKMRYLIHDIIAPGRQMPQDQLQVVTEAVLESVLRKKVADPGPPLSILETYIDADKFTETLIDTLKTMKDKFVRVCQSIRNTSTHEPYASLLAMLFIQSQCWSDRQCKRVQTFCLNTVEKWVIFNKRRLQDQSSVVETELMYLECVAIFLEKTSDILGTQYPQSVGSILADITEKLLHNETKRTVRGKLLDILLSNCSTGAVKIPVETANVATQTGSTSSSRRATPDLFENKKIEEPILYKVPRGTLYPHDKAFLPHVFQDTSNNFPNNRTESWSNSSLDDDSTAFDNQPPAYKNHTSQELMINTGDLDNQEVLSNYSGSIDTARTKVVDSASRLPIGQKWVDSEVYSPRESQTDVSQQQLNSAEEPMLLSKYGSHSVDDISNFTAITAKKIKYTTEELKALNPLKPNEVVTLTEPHELKHLFHKAERARGFVVHNADVDSERKSGIASERYTGRGVPLEVDQSPSSNSQRLENLSDFLSNSLKYGSCVDSGLTCDTMLTQNSNNNNALNEKEIVDNKEETEDWAHGKTSPNLLSYAPTSSSTDCEGARTSNKKSEWPSNFFKEAKEKLLSNTTADLMEDSKEAGPQVVKGSKKKKKTKFRPLDLDQLDSQVTIGADEPGFDDTDLYFFDEFSPEALQSYIDMEEEEKQRNKLEGHMVHGPRMSMNTASARPSLFADVRKAQKVSTAQPWVPKKRKCTRCGSENHILVDCQEGTINDMDGDSSYLF